MNAYTTESKNIDQPGPDLELIEETPLATLNSDIVNLGNCLSDYQQRLADSLRHSDAPKRWGGIRVTRTTLALFAAVVTFTLIVNCLLAAIQADQQQLLQANCGIGILYALVCLSALTDMTSAKSAVSTASEALQMRVQDVTDQLRELMRTRQTWVEESTRSQWMSETHKLKLQLAEQELSARQALVSQHQKTLEMLQASIESAESQTARLSQESAAQSGQMAAMTAQHETLMGEHQQLQQQHTELLDQLGQIKHEIQTRQETVEQLTRNAEEREAQLLADHHAASEKRHGELADLAQQQQAAERELENLQHKISTLVDEASTAEAMTQEETAKLEAVRKQVESTGRELVEADERLNAKYQQMEELDGRIETCMQQKIDLQSEIDAVSQELVALRTQRDRQVADAATEREELHSQLETARAELKRVETEIETNSKQPLILFNSLRNAKRASNRSRAWRLSCKRRWIGCWGSSASWNAWPRPNSFSTIASTACKVASVSTNSAWKC